MPWELPVSIHFTHASCYCPLPFVKRPHAVHGKILFRWHGCAVSVRSATQAVCSRGSGFHWLSRPFELFAAWVLGLCYMELHSGSLAIVFLCSLLLIHEFPDLPFRIGMCLWDSELHSSCYLPALVLITWDSEDDISIYRPKCLPGDW